ncbi:unnamed protein product [Staurois parvus]|uniref:Uncharacterized protein n=1 Tax=Staurois parvus TaxID=386267 RepID=A0ABN9C7N2_9NEOB|nr:unnamed protein product [Staurois parvus]
MLSCTTVQDDQRLRGHSTGMTIDCGHSTGDDQRLRTQYRIVTRDLRNTVTGDDQRLRTQYRVMTRELRTQYRTMTRDCWNSTG